MCAQILLAVFLLAAGPTATAEKCSNHLRGSNERLRFKAKFFLVTSHHLVWQTFNFLGNASVLLPVRWMKF